MKTPAKQKIAARTPRKAPPASAAAGTRPARRRAKSPTAAEVEEIFHRFENANPTPQGELEHTNPFTLVVAVVLSAQATDAGVNKATRALFRLADTPARMAALGEDIIREHIRTIGLYRNKAKNVFLLSQRLIAEHGGCVPQDRAALESLPGVGRKTANVVLNIAFGEPTIAVDTHVFRIARRLGLSRGATPLAVETDLEKRIPKQYLPHAHHWLILHGRYICKARKPDCARCVISSLCHAKEKSV